MVWDQIIIGTSDDKIRERALENQWDYEELISKGKTIEAGSKGADSIRIKVEPGSGQNSVNRTKGPGKYSKKYRQMEKASGSKCKNCSSSRCTDKGKCLLERLRVLNVTQSDTIRIQLPVSRPKPIGFQEGLIPSQTKSNKTRRLRKRVTESKLLSPE